MNAIHSPNPSSIDNVFFINDPGETGKTFLYKTLLVEVRGLGLTAIPVTVASSGIAAGLLCGVTTAHSKFQIPIPITEHSTCNISRQSYRAEKIRGTSLIIWDEAPMMDNESLSAYADHYLISREPQNRLEERYLFLVETSDKFCQLS